MHLQFKNKKNFSERSSQTIHFYATQLKTLTLKYIYNIHISSSSKRSNLFQNIQSMGEKEPHKDI